MSWERPDIAARVALTYNSAMRHNFDATEEIAGAGPAQATSFRSTTPESVNLEFQTGIAPDTLLFGSVRWARWSRFEIAPPLYAANVGPALTSYDSNVVTYRLGIGRRFNDTWTAGDIAVTGGLQYQRLGRATTVAPTSARFSGGSAVAAGLRVAVSF